MATGTMKCPKCGHDRFLGSQHVQGTVSVIVTIGDKGQAFFDGNPTSDGGIDANGLECDDPEGPFECRGCGYEMTDKDLEGGR